MVVKSGFCSRRKTKILWLEICHSLLNLIRIKYFLLVINQRRFLCMQKTPFLFMNLASWRDGVK